MSELSTQKLTDADRLMKLGDSKQALELVQDMPLSLLDDPDQCKQAITIVSNCLNGLSRWAELIEFGKVWIPHLRTQGWHGELCKVHEALGFAYTRIGMPRMAERHIRAAIHVATWDLYDHKLAVVNHRILAILFKNLGQWKQARHELDVAIAIAEEIGATDEIGSLCNNLAILLLKSSSTEQVPALLDRAEQAFASLGRGAWSLKASLVRAKYLRMLGDSTHAIGLLNSILKDTRELRHTREEAICLEYLGDCRLAQRDYRRSLTHYDDALRIAEATAPKGDLVPELCHRLAEAHVHLGDANQAILFCERGLRAARETSDRYEECATHRVLAIAHRAAGNPTKAYRVALEGIELARSYEIPYELARALAWSGETRLQSKTRDDQMLGRLQLWEARAVFERIGLLNEVRTLERLLGFEEEPAPPESDSGIKALAGMPELDMGALRFGIITSSPEVSEAVAIIQSIAPSKIPVLITGPSGVGKELLAHALHRMSDRRRMPFLPVNCGSISASLIESELFGHERGAFTGAVAIREGLFATADKGTIFLDEVGELPPSTQATLLRVLETGELRRLGSDEVRSVDVRVVAATNANLEEMVERGLFRRDLFFRLEGVSVKVPALREREEDIRALFRYFFAEASTAAGKKLTAGEDVEPLLCAYAWPGNVRELKNEVARAVAMAPEMAVLGQDAFLPKLRKKSPVALRDARKRDDETEEERLRILEALRAHGGNKADAARSLGGMKRTTLLYKMDRLRIQPEEYQIKDR